PLVANLVGHEGIPESLRGDRAVPCFPFPETAAQTLARAARYAEWLRRPAGNVPVLEGIDIRAPRRMVTEFLAAHPDGGWFDPITAAQVLASFGIPVVPLVAVASAAEAGEAAARIGAPLALKAAGVLHKTDVGGVRLDLTPAGAETAYDEMAARVADATGCSRSSRPGTRPTPPPLAGLLLTSYGFSVFGIKGGQGAAVAPEAQLRSAAKGRECTTGVGGEPTGRRGCERRSRWSA